MSESASQKKDGIAVYIVLAVAVTLSVLLLARLPLVQVAENWLADLRLTRFSPRQPLSEDIVVITIDEGTLAKFPYRTPVDRDFLAELISELNKRKARAIGLDLLLDQATEPVKDRRLREVLEQSTVPLIVASAGSAQNVTTAQAVYLERYTQALRRGPALISRDRVDSTVRHIFLADEDGEPTFITQLAMSTGNEMPPASELALNYPPAQEGLSTIFPTYDAGVAISTLPEEWIRERIVLIGVDLTLEDRHRTSFAAVDGDTLPGVFIHAYALAQLLEREPARRSSLWTNMLLTLALATLGLVCGCCAKSATAFAIIEAIVASGLIVGAFVLSSASGPIPALLTPLSAFVAASGCVMIRRWYAAHSQARFLRDAFSRYVAPSIVEQLVANPEKLRLSGERRELTFLFTDIAGFTTLTESMKAEPLVLILNEYINGVSRIVAAHEGTIEKIVGDALHVMFNAPVDQPDHAARAVRCAIAIDAYCDEFEQRMQARQIPFGMTRIGVNTGSTVVGNMGGDTRFDYSATGDAINVAARLESANRHLGTRICVGARTRALCEGIDFRPIAELVLKGKSEGIGTFEPVSGAGMRVELGAYLHAFELMESAHPDAGEAFAELARNCPGDMLVNFHSDRLVAGETGSRVILGEK